MGQFGQQKGQPAPNAGKGRYPAKLLTPDEVTALLSTCSRRAPTGIRDRAILMLLYRSGLRITELLSMVPHDMDLKQHSIMVPETKSGKPQTRSWHPSADDALLRWLDVRKTLHTRGAPVFCTLKGGPIHPQQVRNMVKRRAEKAGIEKRVHPHMLRHTFAGELRRGGMDVVIIADLLGHSSIAVTHRYLHNLGNFEAVQALQAISLPEVG